LTDSSEPKCYEEALHAKAKASKSLLWMMMR